MKRMKERITITLDKEFLDWMDEKISRRIFASRSHGFERVITENKDKNG